MPINPNIYLDRESNGRLDWPASADLHCEERYDLTDFRAFDDYADAVRIV